MGWKKKNNCRWFVSSVVVFHDGGRSDFQVCFVDAFVYRFIGLRTIEALAKFFSFSLFTSVRFVDGY